MRHIDRKFCIAPMMEWTDRHCRMFHRQMTRHALLYTEMVTADAILHGKRDRLLAFDASEHPVALQLGGSDPGKLARAAEIGAGYGYDEINLNCGCPSDRVQSGRFGACLMAEPELVAACVRAMRTATALPVTVKCRIGIDDQDSEADFQKFIDVVADAGCATFIVHARKAWLKGLSPKENREVPPLDYERVFRLKVARPNLEILINGGLENWEQISQVLPHVDGVMLGRAAYQRPYDVLTGVDDRHYGETGAVPTRRGVLEGYLPYVALQLARGEKLSNMTRHILGHYHGAPGGRQFRRHLSERAHKIGAGIEVLRDAIDIAEEWAQKIAGSSTN
jgi:tRNA-dihydrouridine synthase A